MTYEELMREVVELRFHNGELKRRLETAEAALRAKGARPAPKRRSAIERTDAQKEGARVIAKMRASINATCCKGLQSSIAKARSHADVVSLYANALGVSWDSADTRVKAQYEALRFAGQPFIPSR